MKYLICLICLFFSLPALSYDIQELKDDILGGKFDLRKQIQKGNAVFSEDPQEQNKLYLLIIKNKVHVIDKYIFDKKTGIHGFEFHEENSMCLATHHANPNFKMDMVGCRDDDVSEGLSGSSSIFYIILNRKPPNL